jgi:hypothetical protein
MLELSEIARSTELARSSTAGPTLPDQRGIDGTDSRS